MLTVTLSYEEWCRQVPDTLVWRRTECMSCVAPLWNQVPGLHRTSLPAPFPTSLIWAQVWSGYCMFTQTATQKVGSYLVFVSILCQGTPSPLPVLPSTPSHMSCPLPHQHQSMLFLALSVFMLITPTVECLLWRSEMGLTHF